MSEHRSTGSNVPLSLAAGPFAIAERPAGAGWLADAGRLTDADWPVATWLPQAASVMKAPAVAVAKVARLAAPSR
jgi:hypothetical protein